MTRGRSIEIFNQKPSIEKCPGQESNLQGILLPPAPQAGASANFATWATGQIERGSISGKSRRVLSIAGRVCGRSDYRK